MSVSELVKDYKSSKKMIKSRVNKCVFMNYLGSVILGFLFSCSGFDKSFSPFGIAFAGSVDNKYTLSAVAGSVLGYFISLDSVDALRYTAAVLALAVINMSLNSIKSIKNNIYVPIISVFACLFVTGLAIVLSKGSGLYRFLVCFSESAVGSGCVYAFSKAKKIFTDEKGFYNVSSKDVTAVVITITLLLLSVKNINLFGVYASHIIAGFLILLCSYYGKEAGGAIVGICTGVTVSLGDGNIMLLALYSLGGLLSGVFSPFGRIACVIAFLASDILINVISFSDEGLIQLAIELAVASVLFVFISLKFNSSLEAVFKPAITSPVVDSVRTDVVNKLKRASEFSKEICTSLTTVNDALDKNENKGTSFIPQKTKDMVCASCGLYETCWVENKADTKSMFLNLLDLKKKGVYLEYKTVPQGFASGCIRTESVSSSFNKLYTEAKMKEKLQGRVREIHSLAAEQFVNMSSLLESICDDVNEDIYFDMDIAARVKGVASACGCNPGECCCTFNSQDKIKLEIKLYKPVDREKITDFIKQTETVVKNPIDLPETQENEDYFMLTFKEKTEFRAVCAGVQFNSNGERYSGDSYSSFTDDKGYFYALICDGMGTGAKAAVSSSLAVTLLEKLIKAGFSVVSAVNTVNTSLISKSGDECSVTLDLFVFDLYTGRGEFFKCGAADTVVKRKGKPINIGFDSLPLGIINNVEISCGNGMLSPGDVVVLCSDGVREEDYYILRNELKNFLGGNVRNFTQDLCETIRRNQPQKSDDMTMLTIAIGKN